MFSSWTTCAFFGEAQGIRYVTQVTNKYLPLLEDSRIDHDCEVLFQFLLAQFMFAPLKWEER